LKESIPGTIDAQIIESWANNKPLMKRIGIRRIIKGESTRRKREIAIIIIAP
jgi:hypothetical protein